VSESRRSPEATFTVIVPTSGRPTLARTLDSIAEQLEPGDEVIVSYNRDGDYGMAARDAAMARARGSHFLFMDDDDQFARGAFRTIRRFAREHPGRIGIFRMRFDHGLTLWTDPVARLGNVSTQMFCVPNVPGKLGSWRGGDVARHGDFEFLRSTIELQGEPLFRSEIVAFVRADRRIVRRTATRLRKLPVRIRYHARRSRVRRLIDRLAPARQGG
jgi:glycosyltransferase involved in cell wall biosynthesis